MCKERVTPIAGNPFSTPKVNRKKHNFRKWVTCQRERKKSATTFIYDMLVVY